MSKFICRTKEPIVAIQAHRQVSIDEIQELINDTGFVLEYFPGYEVGDVAGWYLVAPGDTLDESPRVELNDFLVIIANEAALYSAKEFEEHFA